MHKQLKQYTWNLTFRSGFYRAWPHGWDAYFDLRKFVKDTDFGTVFDVGANVGQNLFRMQRAFPTAYIYCFEPIRSTYEILSKKIRHNRKTKCFNVALGSKQGPASMTLDSDSRQNSLADASLDSTREQGEHQSHQVVVDTLDHFVKSQNICSIDFLKIDTEGFDLEVLRGGEQMLASRRVAAIQVEAGMNRANRKHVPLEHFRNYLEDKGYVLFGIYDQQLEWSGEPRLRFSNPVFVLEEKIRAH